MVLLAARTRRLLGTCTLGLRCFGLLGGTLPLCAAIVVVGVLSVAEIDVHLVRGRQLGWHSVPFARDSLCEQAECAEPQTARLSESMGIDVVDQHMCSRELHAFLGSRGLGGPLRVLQLRLQERAEQAGRVARVGRVGVHVGEELQVVRVRPSGAGELRHRAQPNLRRCVSANEQPVAGKDGAVRRTGRPRTRAAEIAKLAKPPRKGGLGLVRGDHRIECRVHHPVKQVTSPVLDELGEIGTVVRGRQPNGSVDARGNELGLRDRREARPQI